MSNVNQFESLCDDPDGLIGDQHQSRSNTSLPPLETVEESTPPPQTATATQPSPLASGTFQLYEEGIFTAEFKKPVTPAAPLKRDLEGK